MEYLSKRLTKRALRLSIACNFALAAALLWVTSPPQKQTISKGDVAAESSDGHSMPPQARAHEPAAMEAVFRWDKVESTNYLEYVVNLRRIGCPERTIRDLIVAEIDPLYAPRREQLLRDRHLVWSEEDPQLRVLRAEENRLVDYLLHPEADRGLATAAADNASSAGDDLQDVQIPMFMKRSQAKFEFSTEQLQAVDQVQRWFVEEIGGPNQDPTDPQYRRRWQEARPRADSALMSLIGLDAWRSYCNSIREAD
jgi:hypothetical protein